MAKNPQTCPKFSKLKMYQYLRKGLIYFNYLLHVVTHSWKLQCYLAVLVGYGLACPKFSEITNHRYLWKRLSDFIDFLHEFFPLKLQKYSILGYDPKTLLANQLASFFTFELLILNSKGPLLHCTSLSLTNVFNFIG